MAENAYLDDGGLQQVVAWLREKDVGEHQEGYYTSEIFNDYENNIALGPYNHIEGGNNIIADTTDKYYAYAGNPFLDIPSDIKLINLVENSSNYHINSEQGIFSLENIELPEIFTVNNYAEDININEYDYIQKDNKWYPIQQNEIDLVNYQNIENMLSDIFGQGNNILSIKIFSSAEEPTIPTENLILYNSLAYYGEKTYNLSAEEITLLTSINTLETQDNNYITTIYLNESNNFGFVYIMDTNEDEDIIEDEEVETTTDILAEDTNIEDIYNEEQEPTSGDYFSSHSLLINQYDKDNILSIENLTNQIGNFQLINQVYLPHPSAATKENAVYGTDITGIAEYGNQTNLNWEYLNNYDIQLELQPITRELDEEENEINPLKIEVNSTTLVNATIDYPQDSLIFAYQEEMDDTGIITSQKWYLYDEEVNLSTYGITVANAKNGDSFIIYLNKEYISDNEVLTQSEFYEKNHAAGIETYIFQGDSQKWIKKKPDEKVGNEEYCYNHIEGYNNQVKGAYNHAEGKDTTAEGEGCHAEGINTTSSANGSHTEGIKTIASAAAAHAEGTETKAQGPNSHTEGYGTITNSDNGHAEGTNTTADGPSCHAEGYNTVATNQISHAEGNNTQAIGSTSHSEGGYTIAKGENSHAEGYNTKAIGDNSHTEGYNTIASTKQSHAEGYVTTASGYCSHAEGHSGLDYNVEDSNRTTGLASGFASHVEGYASIASGTTSHAEGHGTIAKGRQSHTEGYLTKSEGNNSHSEGQENISKGHNSHSEGYQNQAVGYNSHVEGQENITSDGNSHAEGYQNIAGHIAHVEGSYNFANDTFNSHVEGRKNTVSGYDGNHAQGYNNLISNGSFNDVTGSNNIIQNGENLTVAGSNNIIQDGENSFTCGFYNNLKGSNQILLGEHLSSINDLEKTSIVIGNYNKDLSDKYVYINVEDEKYYQNERYYDLEYNLLFVQPKENFLVKPKDDVLYEHTNDDKYILSQDNEIMSYDVNKQYYIKIDNLYYEVKLPYTRDNYIRGYYEKNDSGEYISVKGRYPYFLKDRTYYTKLDGAEEYQRLVFADDPIIEHLLKKIPKYNFIVGAGTAESTRKNSLELDYQGNLKTSGDIINGDGVVLGAYISNEKIDEIWDSVFEGGRVCLVQTSS